MEVLKEELNQLQEMSEDQLEEMDLEKLVEPMLTHIGSPDPELRDELIYSTFARLIMNDHLNQNTLIHILKTCIDDDYLFYRIGENEEDSVFRRSFSSLVLALIIHKDAEKRFLDSDLAIHVCDKAVTYLMEENDLRGFVEGKGWAHSIAHGADLITVATKHPTVNPVTFYPKCLTAIKKCVTRDQGVYIDNEGERLIFAVEAMLEKGLQETELVAWVDSLHDQLKTKTEEGMTHSYFHLRTNLTHFLQTLYFRLSFKNQGKSCRDTIRATLKSNFESLYH
ncbi:DUF2785 domain-containing protein [Alkalihalobacillus sp. AL-G]|uniref:DUF2785 domain-containing protein n=1 Tax=Alkalihalobacillus sp. AL-G TaxID=2926399 RepID=UPI00272C3F12|nr:DUF2785 domain-containing protein [Alkalihalobacillus sp. AL-G]WLD94368.1 DUF2785 domain-containing protein [Alkalihalobacillus sp. AL-G]